MSKFVNQEISPDHVWINISKEKDVRAAVLNNIRKGCEYAVPKGVYELEDETVSFVKRLIQLAEDGENIRFYILEDVEDKE